MTKYKQKNKKPIHHYQWKFTKKVDLEYFREFEKIALSQGLHVDQILMEMVINYNERNKLSFPLVSEPELLVLLEKKGLSTTRQALRNYRRAGFLQDPVNGKWWYTDGRNIGYNATLVASFIAKRHEYPQNYPLRNLK